MCDNQVVIQSYECDSSIASSTTLFLLKYERPILVFQEHFKVGIRDSMVITSNQNNLYMKPNRGKVKDVLGWTKIKEK